MRRFTAVLLGLALASCMTEPPTSEVEQDLQDPVPGGNFPNAKLGAQPWWNGAQPPGPGPKAGWVLTQDGSGTFWNAVLADPSSGLITLALKVQNQQVGVFLGKIGQYGRILVGRVPPPIGPTGTDWLARYSLELELRVDMLHANAMAASVPH